MIHPRWNLILNLSLANSVSRLARPTVNREVDSSILSEDEFFWVLECRWMWVEWGSPNPIFGHGAWAKVWFWGLFKLLELCKYPFELVECLSTYLVLEFSTPHIGIV